jgi:HNH endonuclease
MAISVRTRFEVFKRDDFTCQYCGKKSPDVVLEIDHIVPQCDGGNDDVINLRTSCWECNRGKADKSLSEIVTGEDPHDRAILLLERERQLREYNTVVATERERRDQVAWALWYYWLLEQGYDEVKDKKEFESIPRQDWNWLFNALTWCPAEVIRNFMDAAINRRMDRNLKYVAACCRNWRYEHQANRDMRGDSDYP